MLSHAAAKLKHLKIENPSKIFPLVSKEKTTTYKCMLYNVQMHVIEIKSTIVEIMTTAISKLSGSSVVLFTSLRLHNWVHKFPMPGFIHIIQTLQRSMCLAGLFPLLSNLFFQALNRIKIMYEGVKDETREDLSQIL